AAWLIPIVWTGIEYFRSELYYLKFSWLNVGYIFSNFHPAPILSYGMYGVGFLIFAATAFFSAYSQIKQIIKVRVLIALLFITAGAFFVQFSAVFRFAYPRPVVSPLSIVGVQLEFPPENAILKMLNQALAKNTNAPIFVLSEYTLDGPVPDSLKDWCREHSRYLIVGGEDPVGTDNYYDTAFVVGTNG